MHNKATETPVTRHDPSDLKVSQDLVAIEEPLNILVAPPHGNANSLAVTLRTPGEDEDLAIGYLFGEGIIKGLSDINRISSRTKRCQGQSDAVVIELNNEKMFEKAYQDRRHMVSGACGACGKQSSDALFVTPPQPPSDTLRVSKNQFFTLNQQLLAHQTAFRATGGLHGGGIFKGGEVLAPCHISEDIGRHNTVDKLVGWSLRHSIDPQSYILVLSSRIGFEIVQKAAMFGIQIIAAVGAPSSLAIRLAMENNITLVGFMKHQGFNVYSHTHRILDEGEHQYDR